MAHTRCPSCRGTKVIKGLGNIEQKCPVCKGVGHVAIADDAQTTPVKRKRKVIADE